MSIQAILGAAVGAVIGALIWGGITYFTNYEIGWVAWAIGGIVGFGAVVLGGEGTNMGLVCAVLALASIFVGKMLAIHFSIQHEIEGAVEAGFTRANYEIAAKDAADYAALPTDYPVAQYMVENEFTEAPSPELVPQEEIDWFNTYEAPELEQFHKDPPSYERWRADREAAFRSVISKEISLAEEAKSGLGPFDILFGLLGIATAFKVGSGASDD